MTGFPAATKGTTRSLGHRLSKAFPWVLFVVVLAVYAWIQVRGFTPAYTENDPDGYLFLAKRMAHGQSLFVSDDDPFQFQKHMWVERIPGQVTSKYPPGYPALMAIGYRLAGEKGMFMVSPVMGGLALVGAWLLFRLWLKPFCATMAFLTLALLPQFLFYGAYLLTHATSLCLTTWGMYFLWRWLAQPRWGWGVAAGAALGASVTVRPTDALYLLPLGVAAAVGLWRGRRAGHVPWAGATALMATWGLFVGLQALYNLSQFGGVTVSGYALSGEQDGFSARFFAAHFGLLLGGLIREFLPVLFPVGLAGMMLWGPPVDRALRLLWFVPVFITYSSYYWVNDNWSCLRFFLSTVPVCIGSAYAVVDQMPASRRVRVGTSLVLLGLFVSLTGAGMRGGMEGRPLGRNSCELARLAEKLATRAPTDAVFFSQQPWCYSLGPRAAYTVYELEAFRREPNLARFADSLPQSGESEPRQQPERRRRLRDFYEASTNQELLEHERTIIRSSLKAGRAVFFLVPTYQAERERQKLGEGFTWETVEEWDVDWTGWGRSDHQRVGLYVIRQGSSA